MNKQQADLLISELGTKIGLPDFTLDENGSCGLQAEAVAIGITFDFDSGMVTLQARLNGLDVNPERLKQAIAANFCWRETGGAAFSLDRLSNRLVLRRRMMATGLDLAGLEAALQAIVIYTRAWTSRLGKSEQTAQSSRTVYRPIEAGLRA